jgi:amino acid transporter
MDASVETPALSRALSRRDLTAMLINAIIGSGMLAAPAKVYGLVGGWGLAVLVASALLIAPMIVCFAELGSRFTGTGGPYAYARAALPGWMAFSVGWLLWISQVFAVATLLNLLVTYLAGFWPVLSEGAPRAAVILAVGAASTAITLRGIRQSADASNLLAILKVGFVLAFILAGVAFIQPARLQPPAAPPPLPTFAQAVMIYIFAYLGFERGSVVAGEARAPQRDVPLALLLAVGVATLAFAGVLLVCQGVLPDPAANDRPLAEVGAGLFGAAGAAAISVGAIAVILGTILSGTVAMPRLLLAMADQGQFPAWLRAVHPRWRTPHVAILFTSTLAYGFALVSTFLGALTFTTASRVLCYVLCCLALWRLSGRSDTPPPAIRVPAVGALALVTGGLFCAALALGATKELPALALALAIGLTFYVLGGLRRPAAQPAS